MGSLHNISFLYQNSLYKNLYVLKIFSRFFSTMNSGKHKLKHVTNNIDAKEFSIRNLHISTVASVNTCQRHRSLCELKTYYGHRTWNIHEPFSLSYNFVGCNTFFTSCVSGKSKKHIDENDDDYEENDFQNEVDSLQKEEEYGEMVKRILHVPEMGHQVLVIQPYVKWGSSKKRNTTPDLQLSEAVTLIRTLKNWKVVDKMKVSLLTLDKKTVFGSGNLQKLKDKVYKDKEITAVFISTDILRGIQRAELEDIFGVPVYDRYMIVVQIFREHAVSKEAKLQVAMAEIPYLRMRLKGIQDGATEHHGSAIAAIGGAGETYIEVRKRILQTRETKLKRMLEKVRNQRSLLRTKRQKLQYPVVAVVGYTNAGKTSLIKALTGERSLQPENYLFATLDVTSHGGVLPSRLKVLYVDTVGFISDIPSNLIESFVATLEDAMLADAIIHVCDVSHPDFKAQIETVTHTLRSLNLSSDLLDNIIVVGNKVDLLSEESELPECKYDAIVSAVTNQGLDDLTTKLDKTIQKSTGRTTIMIRVPSGGEEISWLYKNAAVTQVTDDPEDSQQLLVKVIITEVQLNKFRHNFIRKR